MNESREVELELHTLLTELANRQKYNKIKTYFPDEGPLRRELYKKHLEFFEKGKTQSERALIAGNRVGKSESGGAFELTCHLTGDYPAWWNGRRFDRPISAWAAGDTSKTVKDIIQFKLLGPFTDIGSGVIPKSKIYDTTPKHGIPEAIDTIYVKHISGGISQVTLKSYDQRRESFQGTEKDVIWLDEECPLDIYTECVLRTMDVKGDGGGLIMLTFTPLMGLSETVMAFLPNGNLEEAASTNKAVVMASWDDVPHLSEETKAKMLESIPPFQRDARSKGIPQLGAGAIYPVPETDFLVPDFPIPDHWPRLYGFDVGWNRTAAIWGAWDRETDVIYCYSEHYRGQAEPSIHAQAIKSRGDWVPGLIDPASRGRSQADGAQLLDMYTQLGLKLDLANNGVESGIYDVWMRLSTGRIKVFKSLTNFMTEFRIYRRDEKGRVVKQNDHLMDAWRYLITGIEKAKTKPVEKKPTYRNPSAGNQGWLA